VISGYARAGGRIVLSGVLEEQVELVVAAYRPVCGTVEIEVLEGWARVVLEKGS
jgi:ribosomal protein L11 methylase PrmA